MRVIVKKLQILLFLLAGILQVQAQTKANRTDKPFWAIKTNLLYDATTAFNLGGEFNLGRRTTLEIPLNYNPWTFSDNKKWKHFLVQPELPSCSSARNANGCSSQNR